MLVTYQIFIDADVVADANADGDAAADADVVVDANADDDAAADTDADDDADNDVFIDVEVYERNRTECRSRPIRLEVLEIEDR